MYLRGNHFQKESRRISFEPYILRKKQIMKATLYIYDTIGEAITAKDFRLSLEELEAQGADEFEVHINSYGGVVFEGITIYNLLKQRNTTTIVDGIAASIASVIALAGKKTYMYKNTMLMIHNAHNVIQGDSADMEKNAQDLKTINELIIKTYADKTGLKRDEITALMDAGTFLDAKEALKKGFIDGIVEPSAKNYVGFYYNLLEDDNLNNKGKKMNKEILAFLGLTEKAGEKEVAAKIKELRAEYNLDEKAGLKEIIEAANAKMKSEFGIKDKPEPENPEGTAKPEDEVKKLMARIEALEAEKKKDKAEALVKGAIAEGKILPADETVFVEAAIKNYDATAKQIAAKTKGMALPGKITTGNEDEKPKNLVEEATAYLKTLRGK